MPKEPSVKRAVVFVDGQNLFNQAKNAFGYRVPNDDPAKLGRAVCQSHGWILQETRFYTGIPDPSKDPARHAFWANKKAVMIREGVNVFTRFLRYRTQSINVGNGRTLHREVAVEKGIDVRIALDIITMGHRRKYDVALVFSQDQDFSEVAKEIRKISSEQDRWIKIASAFPCSPTANNRRGINDTDWIPIDKALYDTCIDPRHYWPGKSRRHRLETLAPPGVAGRG